jgi:DNA primase
MVDISNLKNQISPTVFYSNEFQNARFISTGSNWVKVLSTCPFHQDKNPGSFHINNQNGAFHCFACGEKGDMIKFFMNKYNLGFKEAITKLKERYL